MTAAAPEVWRNPPTHVDFIECRECGRSLRGLWVHIVTGICVLCERNRHVVSTR